MNGCKYGVILLCCIFFTQISFAQEDGWQLVWNDEFNIDGPLNSTFWNFEQGYVRNEEAQ